MSDFLTVGKIRDCQDISYSELEVPEWGGKVFLKTLTGMERDKIEQMSVKFGQSKIEGFSAEIALMAICGADKKPLFVPGDLVWLREKSGLALNRVFNEISKINKLFGESVREAAKN